MLSSRRRTALASRDAFAKTPPSIEKIFCLALISGDYSQSKHNPGLDGKAKKREIVGDLRTNCGRNFRHVSDRQKGFNLGEFVEKLQDSVT